MHFVFLVCIASSFGLCAASHVHGAVSAEHGENGLAGGVLSPSQMERIQPAYEARAPAAWHQRRTLQRIIVTAVLLVALSAVFLISQCFRALERYTPEGRSIRRISEGGQHADACSEADEVRRDDFRVGTTSLCADEVDAALDEGPPRVTPDCVGVSRGASAGQMRRLPSSEPRSAISNWLCASSECCWRQVWALTLNRRKTGVLSNASASVEPLAQTPDCLLVALHFKGELRC
ncbi:hypothetical protein Efla_007016 [Eimeria flavescens]